MMVAGRAREGGRRKVGRELVIRQVEGYCRTVGRVRLTEPTRVLNGWMLLILTHLLLAEEAGEQAGDRETHDVWLVERSRRVVDGRTEELTPSRGKQVGR